MAGRIGGDRVGPLLCTDDKDQLASALSSWSLTISQTINTFLDDGGIDDRKFMETSGGTAGFWDEKVNNPDTYVVDDHQLVYWEIETDGTLTLFTNKGAGGGADEEVKVTNAGTPGRLEEVIHADCWEATPIYNSGTHFNVLAEPTDASTMRLLAPYAINKLSAGDSAPGYWLDKLDNVVSGQYNALADIPVKFESLDGSTVVGFIDYSDYPFYSVDDNGFSIASLRWFVLKENKAADDHGMSSAFIDFASLAEVGGTVTLRDQFGGFVGHLPDALYTGSPEFYGHAALHSDPANPEDVRWNVVNMQSIAQFIKAELVNVSNYPSVGYTTVARFKAVVNINGFGWDTIAPAQVDEEIGLYDVTDTSVFDAEYLGEPEAAADAETDPVTCLLQLVDPEIVPPVYRVYQVGSPVTTQRLIRVSLNLSPGEYIEITDTSGVDGFGVDGDVNSWVGGSIRVWNHFGVSRAKGSCICQFTGQADGFSNFVVVGLDVVDTMKAWFESLSGAGEGKVFQNSASTYEWAGEECEAV